MGWVFSILVALGITTIMVYLLQVYNYCEREFKHSKIDRMFLLMVWLMPIVVCSYLWEKSKKRWGVDAAKKGRGNNARDTV